MTSRPFAVRLLPVCLSAGRLLTNVGPRSRLPGDDTFAENPPNALISVAGGNDVSNFIVILSDPQLSDGDLSYAIDLSDGSLTPADGQVTAVVA